MGNYNPNIPIENQQGELLVRQLLANDGMGLEIDPQAMISGDLAVGTVVMMDRANEVWVRYDAETAPDNLLLGIVENERQVRTGGVYQHTNVLASKVYYVNSTGYLTTTETDVMAGYSMSEGNLAVLLNGSGNGGTGGGINAQYFTTAGTHYFTVPAKVKKLKVTCIGGAGGGGGAVYPGSGATGYINQKVFIVEPKSVYLITVGAGGAGGVADGLAWGGTSGVSGGTSSFGNLISAAGGGGGTSGSRKRELNGTYTPIPGVAAFSYSYQTGIYPWGSIGGGGGTAGTAGAVIVEW